MDSQWYSVRVLFRLDVSDERIPVSGVEERIIVVRAENEDQATLVGEKEAQDYAASCHWQNREGRQVAMRYLEACDVFRLTRSPNEGAEVYSRYLFLPKGMADCAIVDRLLGTEEEQGEPGIKGEFEPDFERVASEGERARKGSSV